MLYSDADMDALHILPLAVVPLQTRALQGANLVKNSRLRSVVELFAGEQTGSGQIEIGDLRFGRLHMQRQTAQQISIRLLQPCPPRPGARWVAQGDYLNSPGRPVR